MAVDRNTTIDPQAPASPVENPEIVEVIDLVDGLILDVKTFIASHRYGDFIAKRVRIRESLKTQKPLFACALCSVSVYAVASPEKHFFFRHSVEDGSCPAQTRHGLSQSDILARKYHGLRESEAHKRIKCLIERSLAADPSFVPESIRQETRWRASGDPKIWRQPDVQATRGDQRFAFEVQLSTTFLGVVVERRLFYRDEGATLIWVLGGFEPDYRRLTVDDLLFSNNSNILVVDDETTKMSEDARCFHVRCFYRSPVRDGLAIRDQWEEKLIRFPELTIEVPQQRAYYFDYDGEARRLLEGDAAALRGEVFACWQSVEPHFDGRPESFARWQAVKDRLAVRGVELPDTPSYDSSFRAMMHGLLSAERGAPVGWQFNTLVEVAHHVAQGYPEHLLSFGYALKSSGHDALVDSQDATRKWGRRRERVREQMKAGDPSVMPDQRWLPTLCFLFPEIGARVRSFLTRETAGIVVE
jgi:hypothetical protein